MANLRANRITSTEVFETTGSVQFDGDNDNLSIADSDDFTFGSGDFTLEAWIYPQQYGNFPSIINKYGSSTSWFWGLGNGSSGQDFYFYGSSNSSITNLGNVPLHQWTHCAVSRQGSSIRVFQNGILQGTLEVGNTSMNDTSVAVTIGTSENDLYDFKGHISNARILKGTALYTENFTPPTRELEVIPNTVLLACQSTTNAAEEKTGKTITVNGNAVANELTPGLLTNVVKSGGSSAITGSVEFDGTGDYLSLADSGDWDIAGDYTIEFWTKLNVSDASYTDVILATGTLAGSTGFQIGVYDKDLLVRVNSTQYYNVSVGRMSYDGWNHIAAVWNGSSFKVYLNGIQVHSGTAETTSTSTSLIIGNQTDLDSNRYFNGFISNLRIIKGTALYTSNFIPPTRKLTKLPGTVLLCCQDSNDPTTEATGKTITPYGSIKFGETRYGEELVNSSFWTLTCGGTSCSNWTVSDNGSTLTGTTVTSGFMRATASLNSVNKYLVSLTWTGGNFAVQDDDGYIYATNGTYSDFGSSADGTYDFIISDSSSLIITATSWNTAYTVSGITVRQISDGGAQKFTPSVGSDGSVEFAGPTTINTENYFYLPTGDTESRTLNVATQASSSARGLFGGGYVGPPTNIIDYITISTTGNAQDFGDLTQARLRLQSCSSNTRGVFGGGDTLPSTNYNIIDYVTISSTGNAQDFGDLFETRKGPASCSNSTRGLFAAGDTPTQVNTIDYITIASTGNAQDFGDLTRVTLQPAGCASPTRGVFAGGNPATNTIDFITIQTQGNAFDFGDLIEAGVGLAALSSSTRGVFAGGYNAPADKNTIQYINISTTSNAIDFGDLPVARYGASGCSSITRGIIGGGYSAPAQRNIIEYVTIASIGNAIDFGDLTATRSSIGACSNGHGGLG